ncbi:hypothetical protein BQ8420_25225 [Nocardiopsis sp. JB363]|nr:hypothetical protein BQ8420_25225 [Nocardiopsis sp. JB363]
MTALTVWRTGFVRIVAYRFASFRESLVFRVVDSMGRW